MMPGFGITHDTIKAERELLHNGLERRRIVRENLSAGEGALSRGARLLTAIRSRFAASAPGPCTFPPVTGHIDFSRRQGA